MRPTENEVFNTPIEETFESWEIDGEHTLPLLDDELGLAVVVKPTILEKYGVHCDPQKNSFHESLHNQYEANGRLSDKQVNALRNSR